MRFQIARRMICRWAALASVAALPLGPASVAAPGADPSVTSATLDVAGALKEMADLESRIEQAQRQSLAGQRRLQEASRSLQSVSSTLERKGRLTREGEQFLKTYGDQVQASAQSLDQQVESSHQAIGASRSAIGQASAALLATGVAPSVSAPELLALGLLQETHRDRARLASRRILDLESRRAELAGKTEHAARSVQYQSVFSQYSLQQLRERHEALARQVAEVQAQADVQSRQVARLASRRDELKQLMSRLAEQEATRASLAAAATPSPTPESTPDPSTLVTSQARSDPPFSGGGVLLPAAATPSPATSPLPGQATAPGAAEVPYEEGSAPLIDPIRASEDKDQTDPSGTRFLFWRARPVGVCAPAAGKVLFSGSFAGYRHLLILDHGGGWRSLYGNLAQCPLVPGATVQAGASLGQYQAAVQGARAEPLWFELRQGVQAVAPESWPGMPAQWQARLLTRL